MRYFIKHKNHFRLCNIDTQPLKLYIMSNVSIFEKKWLEIVFEGKNKEYGAYQLRKESTKTNLLALFVGISTIGLMTFGLSSFGKAPEKEEVVVVCPLTPVDVNVKSETKKPEEKKPKTKEPQQSKTPTQKFTQNATLVVASSTEAKPYVPDNTVRNGGSNNPNDGDGKPGAGAGLQPQGNGDGGNEGGGGNKPNPNEVFGALNVEEQPSFPGGMKKFGEYIINNFSADVDDAQYKVTLQFIVEPDGALSNIKVANSSGDTSIDNEAIRVLKSLKTKWSPGKMGEIAVRTQFQQTIVIGN